MRILAVDYGDQRTGIAVSDPTGRIAGDAFVIREWDTERLADKIAGECRTRGVEKIVLGNPVNMDGTVGPRSEKARAFGALLAEKTGLQVVMWDERLTTVAAERALIEGGVRREKRKAYVDMIAAVYILQGYLDSLERKTNE